MIEAVISVALLATASVAVVRLARSSVDLQLRADREMAAALTAQNVLRRLDALPSGELNQQVAELEQSYGQESGCDVSISIGPFDREGTAGLHLRVEVTSGNQVRVTLHDWRLEAGPGTESETATDADQGERQDGAQQDE